MHNLKNLRKILSNKSLNQNKESQALETMSLFQIKIKSFMNGIQYLEKKQEKMLLYSRAQFLMMYMSIVSM